MLKRKCYNDLIEWKQRRIAKKNKDALIIKGARQVGKTSIVELFGSNEYKSFVKMNFVIHPEQKDIFNGELTCDTILKNISLFFPEFVLIPGSTLIFLDEIQACGKARTAIKSLAVDFRFDVIASGSLLGLEYGEDDDENVEIPDSIPVGFETSLNMYSMDFEEYLWAKGYNDEHLNYLKSFFEQNKSVPTGINEKFENLFREYIIVGGMPEVVATFIDTNNFNEAIKVQNKILSDYQGDISKHAKGEQKVKVRACYDSIPKQLSKEFKKFQYSIVEKGKTSQKYGGSVKWLVDSSLVNKCTNISEPYLSLIANEKEEQFKLYINDTGLLTAMYGRATKIAIINNTIKGNTKGAIYENVISECLIKNGYSLHYYKPDDNHELEFLIEQRDGVVPIEVKGGNTSSKSLNNFINDYNPKIAYKLIDGNIGIDGVKKTIPHYMIIFI